MPTREWTLKRNCSLAPRQLALAYLLLCVVSLAVAAFFTLGGAWYVLGYSILEMAAVAWAFVHYARHATDCERIVLDEACLRVELIQSDQTQRFMLNAHATRIAWPLLRQDLIGLEADGIRVDVGRFLTEWKRREFARELQGALSCGR